MVSFSISSNENIDSYILIMFRLGVERISFLNISVNARISMGKHLILSNIFLNTNPDIHKWFMALILLCL